MELPHKLFIQMSGAPGSGKTSIANLLARSINGVIINHDVIKSFFLENKMPFDQSAKLAYSFQWTLAEDMLNQGHHVIIDSTCNYKEVLDQGAALAQRYGYEYKYVECRVNDIDLLDQRIRTRVPLRSQRTGVHAPPPDSSSAHHNKDHIALFKKWIEHPCRPAENGIVVDSSERLEECVDYILKQIVTC